MSKLIATVKLAPGKVALYDEYSKIHLTLSNPVGYIYEGMDLRRIRACVKSGSLKVLSGSLTMPSVTEVKVSVPSVSATKVEKAPAAETVVKTEVVEIAPEVAPEQIEKVEATEEVVEEKKPVKRTRKAKEAEAPKPEEEAVSEQTEEASQE